MTLKGHLRSLKVNISWKNDHSKLNNIFHGQNIKFNISIDSSRHGDSDELNFNFRSWPEVHFYTSGLSKCYTGTTLCTSKWSYWSREYEFDTLNFWSWPEVHFWTSGWSKPYIGSKLGTSKRPYSIEECNFNNFNFRSWPEVLSKTSGFSKS